MNIRKSFVILALATVSAGFPAAAGAAPIFPIPDSLFQQYQKDFAFVAEGQVNGNRSGIGQFQLGLGSSTNNPQSQTSYNWLSKQPVSFILNYNSSTRNVTFKVGTGSSQKTLSYTNTSNNFINGIVLRTIATKTALPNGNAVLFPQSLTVNGTPSVIPSGNQSIANSSSPFSDVLFFPLSPTQFSSMPNFTLQGLSVFNFTGNPPAGSDLSYQIWVGNAINLVGNPVPGAIPESNPMSLISIAVCILSLYALRHKQTH